MCAPVFDIPCMKPFSGVATIISTSDNEFTFGYGIDS